MITMFDSSHADTIPADAKFVAGYIDGSNSLASVRQKAPHATSMSIAIHARHDADCLDVEPQCADVDEVTDWLTRQHARGVARPVIYADISHMKLVLDALERAHVARSSVRLWSAHYLANQNVPAAQLQAFAHICGPHTCGQLPIDMDGTQFTSQSRGVSLDESRLVDNFFGAPPKPPSVFISTGTASLNDLAKNPLHSAVSTVIRLTAENSPGAVFREGMAGYLNGVFATDKEKVPTGITVYHPQGSAIESFQCAGTQTLQGLALAFKCQPSAIVRLTAENSPGAVFSGQMADYLNDVFSRSTTPVPHGVHLYYQK
jgi:hypothetical protein